MPLIGSPSLSSSCNRNMGQRCIGTQIGSKGDAPTACPLTLQQPCNGTEQGRAALPSICSPCDNQQQAFHSGLLCCRRKMPSLHPFLSRHPAPLHRPATLPHHPPRRPAARHSRRGGQCGCASPLGSAQRPAPEQGPHHLRCEIGRHGASVVKGSTCSVPQARRPGAMCCCMAPYNHHAAIALMSAALQPSAAPTRHDILVPLLGALGGPLRPRLLRVFS